MAAILKLRRASTTPNLVKSELFYNEQKETLQIGKNDIASTDVITLVKLTEVNTGNLQIVGTISGSALNLSGDISASNAYFRGDVRLDGQIVLGDVPQDNINVNAQFSGSLIPSASTFDLGSTTKKWNNVYANNLNGSITDTIILSFTESINNKFTTLGTYTGSVDNKFTTIATYTGSVDNKFTTLGTYTESVDNKFTTLETYTESIDSKFTTLETYTSSIDTKNSTLGTYTESIDNKFATIQSYTESVDSKLENLINVTGSYATTGSNTFDGTQYISGGLTVYSASSAEVKIRTDLMEYHLHNTPGGNFSIHNSALGTSIFRIDSGSTIGNSHAHLFGDLYVSKSIISETAVTAPLITGNNLLINSGSISGSITGIGNVSQYSQSVDSRILSLNSYTASNDSDITELYASASNHETRIDGIQDYTASLRTAIGVNGSDVTINGDLSVLGTTTQINSTQVNIGENIIELNYGGSANTAGIITKDATGASIISGSLLWDSTNDYWKAGKLANESKILLAGGDGVVSGSAQVVDSLKFTFLEIDGDDVVSGSSQVDLTQTTNYVSGIKDRLDAEGVFSGSTQVNADSITNFDSNVKDKLNAEGVVSGSSQVVDGLKTTFLEINGDNVVSGSFQINLTQTTNYVSGIKDRLNIEGVVSGSSQVTASLDGRYELQGRDVVSGSSQVTASLDGRYELQGNGIVSQSSQLTASYDLRYANSSSFHNLVGAWDFGTQGSIRDAAFYSVTSSADIALVSGSINYTNNHLLTAGATKKYIDWRTDEILSAIAVADITSVTAGNGLNGGGLTGDVTLSLDTSSATFTNGVKTKLDTEGVISGSSQVVIGSVNGFSIFSASVDYRLDSLETDSGSQAGRLNNLEIFTASINTTYEQIASGTHTLISGSRQLDGKYIDNLSGSFTGSFKGNIAGTATNAGTVLTQNSNVNQDYSLIFTTSGSNGYMQTYTDGAAVGSVLYNPSTNRLKSTYIQGAIEATNGVLSGSAQIIDILGPLNTFSASQETKNSTLATYTGSVDNSLSGLNAVSHSHSNKVNLDTINQNLSTTSDVQFNDVKTEGSASIGTNLTIYGNLKVWGTQSIINSTNVELSDNILYLAPTGGGDYDIGVVGHWNDGTYQHGGIFSDASDGHTWKVFKGLQGEVSGAFVDTAGVGFALADFKADNITATSFNGIINATNGVLSGSLQAQLPAGVVSGSSQVSYTGLSNIPAGIVSGSSQVNADSITNFDANVLQYNNSLGVISGSSQVTLSSTIGGGTSADVQFNSLGIGMTASTTTGRIDATNDIVAYSSSDRRFKENITPIENALDKINQIGGYEFDWKDENKIEHGYEGHDLGVIAQEIEAIAPELVQTRENGYKAVKYDKLVSVLIQAIKELSAKVTELENK